MWRENWSSRIALGASFVSLAMSLVTFFYTFVLQIDDIKVFGDYPILTLDKKGTFVDVKVRGELTFSNSGNRSAVVRNIVIGALISSDERRARCDYRAIYHSIALKMEPVAIEPGKVATRQMAFDKRIDLTDQKMPSEKVTNVALCGVASVVSPDVNYDLRVFSLGGVDGHGAPDLGDDSGPDIDAVPMQSLLRAWTWSFKFLSR